MHLLGPAQIARLRTGLVRIGLVNDLPLNFGRLPSVLDFPNLFRQRRSLLLVAILSPFLLPTGRVVEVRPMVVVPVRTGGEDGGK